MDEAARLARICSSGTPTANKVAVYLGLALGARLGRIRLLALAAITLLCGASTAAVGPISFVGLVAPHVLRLVLGADQRRLLAASLVAGPILLLTADIVGRLLIRPDEMEAGVVTAFIGGPVLLAMVLIPTIYSYLLFRKQQKRQEENNEN